MHADVSIDLPEGAEGVTGVGLESPALAETGTTERNVKRSLRSGAFRALLSAPLSLLTGPFIVHHVGLTNFGTWSTLVTVLFVGTLLDAGVSTEIVRRVADAQGRGDRESMQRSVSEGTSLLAAAGLLVTVLGASFSPIIVRFALPGLTHAEQHQAAIVFSLVLVLLLAQLIATAYFSVLVGLQRQDVVNRAGVVSNVVSTGATIGLAFVGFHLWALVIGNAIGVVLTIGLQMRGLRRLLPEWRAPIIRVHRSAASAFMSTAIFLSLGNAAELVDTQLDKIMLARFASLASTAEYQIGASLALQVRAIALMPLVMLLPGVAERRATGTHRQFYNRVATPIVSAAIAAMSGVVCVGYPFATLLYGNSYGQVGEATRAFGACGIFAVLAAPWTFYAVGNGYAKLTAFSAGIAIVVNAAVSSTLIVLLGFPGSLIGSFAASVAGALALGLALRRADPEFSLANGRFVAAVGSMCCVAGAAWIVIGDRNLSLVGLLLLTAVAGLALASCLIVTRAVTVDDVRVLLRRQL